MSMRRRYEPMGGEGDCSQIISSSTRYAADNSSDEIESIPSDSFVDDLTLRVRSLLMNFEETEAKSDVSSNRFSTVSLQHEAETCVSLNCREDFASHASNSSKCGFNRLDFEPRNVYSSKYSLENQDAMHDPTEASRSNNALCGNCSILKTTAEEACENPVNPQSSVTLSKSYSGTFVPHLSVDKSCLQPPRIVLTETELKTSLNIMNCNVTSSKQRKVENPQSYQSFSDTLQNDNPRARQSTNEYSYQNDIKNKLEVNPGTSSDHGLSTNAGKYKFSSVQHLPISTSHMQVGVNEPFERESERSWSEIIVAAESFSKSTDQIPSKILPVNKNKSISFIMDSKQFSVLSRSLSGQEGNPETKMSSKIPIVEEADIHNTLADNWKSNASTLGAIDKEYEFLNNRSLSSLSDFDSVDHETPPLSASSIGSSKRLEWDNGADIGYSIANANSKLKRQVPNTARSEPEGISLINETLNVNTSLAPISFPSFMFPSLTTAPDLSFSRNTLINSTPCDAVEEEDLERSSSPEASLSRSDSKRSVIYNSTRDVQVQSKIIDRSQGCPETLAHSFKNSSCPDLTDLCKSATGYHSRTKVFPYGKLSKSDEVVSLNKKPQSEQRTAVIDPSGFPNINAIREALEQNLFREHNKPVQGNSTKSLHSQEYSKNISFANLSHTCRSCHQSTLQTQLDDMQQTKSESENSYKSKDDDEESFELANGNTQVYNVTQLSHHGTVVDWIDENTMFDPDFHYIAEMSELPPECRLDALHSRPFLFLSNTLGKLNENQVPKNVGSLLSSNLNDCSTSGNLETKPHIRWYPFTSANIQDIKNVSTQTAMSFIAKQLKEPPVQVASEQQTSSPEGTRMAVETTDNHSVKLKANQSSSGYVQIPNNSESSSSPEYYSSSETILPVSHEKVNQDVRNSESSALCDGDEKSAFSSKWKHHQLLDNYEVPMNNSNHEQGSNLQPNTSAPLTFDSSKMNSKNFCWLTEQEEVEFEVSSPDMCSHERKLGVGQCETVPRSAAAEEIVMNKYSKAICKEISPQMTLSSHSSSDSDPINYQCAEHGNNDFNNIDDVLESDSSTRSSVVSHCFNDQKKILAFNQPAFEDSDLSIMSMQPTSRYYFTKSTSMGSNTMGSSDRHGARTVKPNSSDIIEDANRVISDSKLISTAVKRLNSTDLYSQSRPLSRAEHLVNKEKIPKSHSDPLISSQSTQCNLSSRETNHKMTHLPVKQTEFGFKTNFMEAEVPRSHERNIGNKPSIFKASTNSTGPNSELKLCDRHVRGMNEILLKRELPNSDYIQRDSVRNKHQPYNVGHTASVQSDEHKHKVEAANIADDLYTKDLFMDTVPTHQHSSSTQNGSRTLSSRGHPLSPVTLSETDNLRNHLRTFEKKYTSIGVQVSDSASAPRSCNFCHRAVDSHFNHCYEKEKFKAVLSHTLQERLDPLQKICSRSGASFCVFSSGCVCCCSKTLQQAFNIHRSELAERIEARKNDVIEKARKNHFINFPAVPHIAPRSENSTKKRVKSVPFKPQVHEKSSSNKENKNKSRRNYVPPHVVAKLKGRQKSLNNYNRIMSKIYSQRLKSETLKGKVNYERHENLITS